MLQKLEMLQQAEDEHHQDYNPWAEDEKKDLKAKNKKELGEAMLDPQKILSRYGWEKPPISINRNGYGQSPFSPPTSAKLKRVGTRREDII